jgi:hypothetical protein
MIKPKATYRNSDPRLKPGMAVRMSDGWAGKIEQDAGSFIVCIGNGERPNIHWVGDYRLVGRSLLAIEGDKVMVIWKSAAAASRPIVDRGRPCVVIDLARSRLEREWDSAPD